MWVWAAGCLQSTHREPAREELSNSSVVNEQAQSTSGVSTPQTLLLAGRAKPWPSDVRSVFNAHRLKEHLKALPVEEEMVLLPSKVKAIGQIECLSLTVGAVPVECAALVVGECLTLCSSTVAWALLPLTPAAQTKL